MITNRLPILGVILSGWLAFGMPAGESIEPSRQIPFVAAAGAMRAGIGPAMELDATRFGVSGADAVDDTRAMSAMLVAAREQLDRGAVQRVRMRLPAGEVRISSPLFLDRPGMALVGSGSTATRIVLLESLRGSVHHPEAYGGYAEWSFRGGMIWVESGADAATAAGPVKVPLLIRAPAPAGSRILTVAAEGIPASGLQPGTVAILRWDAFPAAQLDVLFGATRGAQAWTPREWGLISAQRTIRIEQPAVIDELWADGRIALSSPLRVPIDPGSRVAIGVPRGMLRDVVISDLAIEGPDVPPTEHLQEEGYNGIFARYAVDCRFERLGFINVDNAIVLERSHHITMRDLRCSGKKRGHHALSLRNAHDNLVDQFAIVNSYHHGISVQDMASGNVFTRGVMASGTFDSHRGMPFDNVRTEIVIAPWGSAGGATGPLVGRRMVNWNIEIRWPKGTWGDDPMSKKRRAKEAIITGSQWYVSGALVGIRGADPQPESVPWSLPPGEKGTLVAQWGAIPEPANLFDAQRAWWQSASAAWRSGQILVP